MNPNDGNPTSAPGPASRVRRGTRITLIVAGLLGACFGALAYLRVGLGGLWDWTSSSAGPGATMPGQASQSSDDGPFASGRLVYQAHCVRCHGPEGHGGPADEGMTHRPPIRDLAAPSWRTPDAGLAVRQIITRGIPEKGMPGTGGSLSSGELDRLVDYVLSLELTAFAARAGFTPAAGQIAPAVSYRDASPVIGSLERFRGKVVLLAFWGTTCIPCMEELPELEKLADRFRGTDLVILPVCLDEANPKTAGGVAARVAPGLTVAVDADGKARKSYGVLALPQAFLIDRAGRVVAKAAGARKWDRKEVDELFCAALGVAYPPAQRSRAIESSRDDSF